MENTIKLLDAAIFNAIVGNADAHGKNFSILHDDDGPRLSTIQRTGQRMEGVIP